MSQKRRLYNYWFGCKMLQQVGKHCVSSLGRACLLAPAATSVQQEPGLLKCNVFNALHVC